MILIPVIPYLVLAFDKSKYNQKVEFTSVRGKFAHITEDKLQGMLDELLKEFNQSSILVEKELESHIYYSGK